MTSIRTLQEINTIKLGKKIINNFNISAVFENPIKLKVIFLLFKFSLPPVILTTESKTNEKTIPLKKYIAKALDLVS